MKSKVVRTTRCPKCAEKGRDKSGNNLVYFASGPPHCFACGASTNDSLHTSVLDNQTHKKSVLEPLEGEIIDLHKRGIRKDTCEKYGTIYLRDYMGKQTLAFPYFNPNGDLVHYHLKPSDKDCRSIGSDADAEWFGSRLHGDPRGKTLIITEGHEDAMVVNQLLGDIYHTTTLSHGAGTATKFVKKHYKRLLRYQSIVLAFDMDQPGRDACATFIKEFNQIGIVRVAKLPGHDANEAHINGLDEQLKWSILKAEAHKPKQCMTVNDIRDKVLIKPTMGRSWPWASWNNITYGAHLGHMMAIAGGEGCGKTYLINEIVTDFISTAPIWNTALFSLEQSVDKTLRKMCSIRLKMDLSNPTNPWWNPDKINKEMDSLQDHVFFYDPQKGINADEIIQAVQYFVNVHNVQVIVLDNLTIFGENIQIGGKTLNENQFLNEAGKIFNRLAMQLNILVILVAHLNTDSIGRKIAVPVAKETVEAYDALSGEEMSQRINKEGLSWETGRMPSAGDIANGSILKKLCADVIVIGRNRRSYKESERRTLKCDILKKRDGNDNVFNTRCDLISDPITGRLNQIL